MSFLRKMKRSMGERPKNRRENPPPAFWHADNNRLKIHMSDVPEIKPPKFSGENVEFYNLSENPDAYTHCDDLSDKTILPFFVKEWVDYERLPASMKFKCPKVPSPFAFYRPENSETDIRVALSMASRFGDVGIRPSAYIHDEGYGYNYRTLLTKLENFHQSAIEFEYGKPGTPYNMQDSAESEDLS